jgi:hypothetical protein
MQEEKRVEEELADEKAFGSKRCLVNDYDEMNQGPPSKKIALNAIAKIKEETLWKLNIDKFHVLLRSDELVKLATTHVNKAAGEVLKTILAYGHMRTRTCKGNQISAPITQILLSTLIDPSLDLAVKSANLSPLKEYMEYLTEMEYLHKTDEKGGGMYVVNLAKMSDGLRIGLIENYVREKYGTPACRIWKLLLDKGLLDEKMIATSAMISDKEASSLLYDLLRNGLTYIQDVPKSANHEAGKCAYLWGVNLLQCLESLTTENHTILVKLKQRRAYEAIGTGGCQISLVLDKLQRTDVAGDPVSKLTNVEKDTYQVYEKKIDLLKASEFRVDFSTMVLRDF